MRREYSRDRDRQYSSGNDRGFESSRQRNYDSDRWQHDRYRDDKDERVSRRRREISQFSMAESHKEKDSRAATRTLMIKGIDAGVDEQQIASALMAHGISGFADLRIIKNKVSGENRGFGFIDFATVEDARRVLNIIAETTCRIFVGTRQLSLDYADEKGDERSRGPEQFRDWICGYCSELNFARRRACISCFREKDEMAQEAGQVHTTSRRDQPIDEEVDPSEVVIIKGLSDITNAEDIIETFRPYAPVKDIRIVRDKITDQPRGFCFVEFFSVEAARRALEGCNRRPIICQTETKMAFAKGGKVSAANAAMGSAAVEQAMSIAAANRSTEMFRAPEGYVFDVASGYYYSPETQYYFDCSTGYFYANGVFFYYDHATGQYHTVREGAADNSSSAKDESSAHLSSGTPGMHDNHKTDKEQAAIVSEHLTSKSDTSHERESMTASELQMEEDKKATDVIPKDISQHQEGGSSEVSLSKKTTKKRSVLKVASNLNRWNAKAKELRSDAKESSRLSPDITGFSADIRQVEGKFACLLCMRQFKDEETANKHVLFSELHRNNLQAKKQREQQKESSVSSCTEEAKSYDPFAD